MKIDIRFEQACESERLTTERKKKNELMTKINSIIRSSPLGFAQDLYDHAHIQKMKLLGEL